MRESQKENFNPSITLRQTLRNNYGSKYLYYKSLTEM